MNVRIPIAAAIVVIALALAHVERAAAGGVDPSLYAGLHWRNVGPFRGGRAVAVSGVSGNPRTFYFGAVGGGVWKSQNAGLTWSPVSDALGVASMGAVAVAPSDPATIYAGSGEADMRSDIIHGNGMYRSTDGGATWTHAGLDDSRQIGRILVDPRDPRTLLVSALGHAFGPNDVRGVYRSTDGGASWTRTLFLDPDTGAIDLASDPSMRVVFASLWQTRRPPWSVYAPSNGPGSGLWQSRDGGTSWSAIRGAGLPGAPLGKIGLAVAPSDPRRVYAIIDAKEGGLYRSDDGGGTWRRTDAERRIWQRGWYFCHVAVDPRNADVVYVSNTSLYRSTDGGASFVSIKGSPDGDDFHQLWIDPTEPERMVLGSDQGATVSIDGGRTWSSWFNQPTGQFYGVAADAAFAYRLFGAQQDNGAAAVLARSPHRGIQERDWRPISAGGESGQILADPRDRDAAFGGLVEREDFRTNQTRTLSPLTARPGVWRREWTQPLALGPDGALYTAAQTIFRSRDGGLRWVAISGDLARPRAGVPPTLDPATAADADGPEPRGVVYALAPSPRRAATVWAGTDDGLVYLTRDGRSWRNVSPSGLTAWSSVDAIDASPFDERTAYVAVERHRLDDDRPFVYVTHDAGRTWRLRVAGIDDRSFVYVVREDPLRRGLLYAGTDTGVFVSFDDGASWQSLRMNMPVASIRDLRVLRDDLVIATHGRAFWVLDDLAPLRQLAVDASPGARLFRPAVAFRVRPGDDEAEALPPEIPLGENPPAGAFIDYAVPNGARGPLSLTVNNAAGETIRRWSSDDRIETVDAKDVDFPAYWLQPAVPPAATTGMHRFVWDLRARAGPDAPWAPPGAYAVTLSLDGRTYAQPLVVRRDPRVRASDADLVEQYRLAREIDALAARVARVQKPPASLKWFAEALRDLEASVESADAAPTSDERAAWSRLRPQVERALHTTPPSP